MLHFEGFIFSSSKNYLSNICKLLFSHYSNTTSESRKRKFKYIVQFWFLNSFSQAISLGTNSLTKTVPKNQNWTIAALTASRLAMFLKKN